MLMWTLDKFVRPDHAASLFANFYPVGGLSHAVAFTIGALAIGLLVAFIRGGSDTPKLASAWLAERD